MIQVKSVFVDYDDTLHNSTLIYGSKLNGFLGLQGEKLWQIYLVEIHRNIIHNRYPERHDDDDFHIRLLYEYLGKPYNPITAKKILKSYREAQVASFSKPYFFEDAKIFLQSLKKMWIKIILTTGDRAEKKAACLESFVGERILSYAFDEVKLSYRKLDPDFYRQALKLSKSSPMETVCVGDTLEMDIASSKAAGLRTIWVNRKGEGASKVASKINPDFVASNLIEALRYIEKHF